MCGIVGVITKASNGFTYPQQDLFEEMLVCDAVRGMDSTGVFSVANNGNAHMLKLASHPFNLIKSPDYRSWKSATWSNGKVLIGHNRKATVGAVTNENAHPFAFGPVLMVHNGYIDNYRSLVHHKERDKLKIEVDSAALALMLSREDPMKVLPELRGAFTLVWYNATEKNLYLVRNTERPLAMVEGSDGSYYASEKGMLRWLMKRRNASKIEIAELKPGVLLSINIDGKSEVREVKLHEKTVSVPVQQPISYQNPTQSAPRKHHEPLIVDQDGVVHLPEQRNSRYVPKEVVMAPQDAWNIHYGADKHIQLDKDLKWPQIVFSVDDFKMISEEHVEPPVWKLWGPALDSKRILVHCQFRGSEHEVEKLAYATHLCGHITRVATRAYEGEDGQFVACTVPRAVNLVTTPNGLPIIDEQLEYIKKAEKCTCNAVDYDTTDTFDTLFIRDGFHTAFVCKWCVEGTPSCKELCEKPGQCDYCLNAVKERNKAQAS